MKQLTLKEILRAHKHNFHLNTTISPKRALAGMCSFLAAEKKRLSVRVKEGEALSGGERWLFDNAALLLQTAGVLSSKKARFPLSLYVLFGAVLREYEGVFGEAELAEIFDFLAEEKVSHRALFCAKETLVCALLVALKKTREEGEVSRIIKSVQNLSRLNVAPFLSAYSPLEKILRREAAGVFEKMDSSYRARLCEEVEREAEKHGVSAESYAETLVRESERRGVYVGELTEEKKGVAPLLYSFLTAVFSLVLGAVYSAAFARAYPLGWAAFLGFLLAGGGAAGAVIALLDAVFSRTVKSRSLWRVHYDALPEEASALVVYTALLSRKEDVGELCEKLSRAAFSSFVPQLKQEHLRFALLLDLPAAKTPVAARDAELLDAARRGVQKLNETVGDYFCLFVRPRTRTEEGDYSPWERKRGALLQLASFLCGKESSLECLAGEPAALVGTHYVLTLDSDTVVTPRAVQELVGILSHPKNRPVVKYVHGVPYVAKGYGILQPLVTPTAESSVKSPFSLLKSGAGGLTAYSTAAFDRAQTLFSRGHYCGKGLFDVRVYDEVLNGAFEDGKILSHDLLEGALLSAAAVTDVVLLDETPSTARAASEREHRWCRGDVQSLYFSGPFRKNRKGERVRNPMPFYYRMALWDNLRRALLPLLSAVMLLLSVFVPPSARAVTVLSALLPYAVEVAVDFLYLLATRRTRGFFTRFYSPHANGTLSRLLNLGYDLSSLFWEAYLHADAALRALWRMSVSGKRRLEWRTAQQTSTGAESLLGYWKTRFVSVAAGVFLLFFSDVSVVRLTGLLSLLHPLFAYLLSRPYVQKKNLSKQASGTLVRYARASACFFLKQVGEFTNHLPPDHFTFSPIVLRAMRTSPTNIGLYLASLCVMVDFGVLSVQDALFRLEKSLTVTEQLPRYRGLLYNWYDLETLKPLSDYVSSVDCGNYLACLYVVLGFLKECAGHAEDVRTLEERVKRLCDEVNLRLLYHSSVDLFYVGLWAESGKYDNAHYDQYMSEARLTSYLAIARGQVPLRHWRALSRPVFSVHNHLGVASFSGTAFEYFLPALFLQSGYAGFEKEALFTAALCQRRAAVKSPYGALFGVSESAYFASDALGDYPYRANGVESLALSADSRAEEVISPYSSFLMLPALGNVAVENLERMRRAGVYGEYGFYESCQVSPRGVDVVESVFAHHTGMLLLAAANAVQDGVVCRRFLESEMLSAFLPLVAERVSAEGIVRRAKRGKNEIKTKVKTHGTVAVERHRAGAVVLPAHSGTFLFGFDGRINLLYRKEGGLYLFRDGEGERRGLCVRAKVDGVIYSTRLSENPVSSRSRVSRIAGGVRLSVLDGARRVFFEFRLSGKENCLQIQTHVIGGAREGECALFFSPLFATQGESRAHGAFCTLKLAAKKTDTALFVTARRKGGKEYALCVLEECGGTLLSPDAVVSQTVEDCGGALRMLREDVQAPFEEGVFTSPSVLCRRRLSCSQDGTQLSHGFYLAFSEGAHAALVAAQNSAKDALSHAFCTAENSFARASFASRTEDVLSPFCRGVTAAVLNAECVRVLPSSTESFSREELYAFGISGDLPIVLCKVEEDADGALYRRLVSLHRFHAICGFSYDLVFFAKRQGYARRGLQAAEAAVRYASSGYLLFSRGGVFLLEGDARAENLFSAACCLSVTEDTLPPVRREEMPVLQEVTDSPPAFFSESAEESGGSGTFLKKAFLIQRDVYDPKEVFSHFLSSETFGALVTHRSLGFTFETSSRFRRLTRPTDDAYAQTFGERALLSFSDGRVFDLAASSCKVRFSLALSEYFGTAGELQYRLRVFCHPTLLFRACEVELFGRGEARLAYEILPVLGDECGVLGAFCTEFSDRTLKVRRVVNVVHRPFEAYLKLCGKAEDVRRTQGIGLSGEVTANGYLKVQFYLGAKESERQFSHVSSVLEKTPFDVLLSAAQERMLSRLPAPVVEEGAGREAFSRAEFLNYHLPYQAISSRLLSRCGFYQAGGAYGFRDQLQDALLYLSFDPERLARQILRHAAHQFLQGDVLHWWHNLPDGAGRHRGVRTRISDDYLWLIYATCRYVKKTGNRTLLWHRIPFLTGAPLKDGERDRYDAYAFGEKGTLAEHLAAAAELFLHRGVGAHSLALILAGDWNDGMDALGDGAESVFLSQFGALCLLRLSDLFEEVGLYGTRLGVWRASAHRLLDAVQKTFNGRWFARAYFGDGEALGSDLSLSSPCSIDVLPQAFSAFCFLEKGGEDREELSRVLSALSSVWDVLYDKNARVLKLFTPPFDPRGREVGYIQTYRRGVRENGGQYTHAAAWYALACRSVAPFSGEESLWRARAQEVAEAVLPHRAALSRRNAQTYRLEPYALAGDVYTHGAYLSRGGWNHYTGSAAWMWRYFAENGEDGLV